MTLCRCCVISSATVEYIWVRVEMQTAWDASFMSCPCLSEYSTSVVSLPESFRVANDSESVRRPAVSMWMWYSGNSTKSRYWRPVATRTRLHGPSIRAVYTGVYGRSVHTALQYGKKALRAMLSPYCRGRTDGSYGQSARANGPYTPQFCTPVFTYLLWIAYPMT